MNTTRGAHADAVRVADRLAAARNGDVLRAFIDAGVAINGVAADVMDRADALLWDRMDAGQRALTGAPLVTGLMWPCIDPAHAPLTGHDVIDSVEARATRSARKHARVTMPEYCEAVAA